MSDSTFKVHTPDLSEPVWWAQVNACDGTRFEPVNWCSYNAVDRVIRTSLRPKDGGEELSIIVPLATGYESQNEIFERVLRAMDLAIRKAEGRVNGD